MSDKFFAKVIDKELIDIYFQPIISLNSSKVIGYEALARIEERPELSVLGLFEFAEKQGIIWELEELCRTKTLKKIKKLDLVNQRIFVNISPKVLSDSRFVKSMSRASSYLKKHNINSDNIVFEINDRNSIDDMSVFQESIEYYKKRGVNIALDNMGKGYSGLSRICSFMPSYIKADESLTRGVDTTPLKASLIGSFVEFCLKNNIHLIAEGVETEQELKVLKRLGVESVQGLYVGKPKPSIEDISADVRIRIKKLILHNEFLKDSRNFLGRIESICSTGNTVSETVPGSTIFEMMKEDDYIRSICVLNECNQAVGLLTYNQTMKVFGGRYGFDLHYKKPASDFMQTDFLEVESITSIEDVSKMALARENQYLYDPIIVSQDKQYLGSVSVKDLLEAAISIQVNMAADKNPLTGLYGNSVIEKTIRDKLNGTGVFSAIYMDLDNFKAYNDAYGFYNGDKMIKTLAQCVAKLCKTSELAGHIGGDDFIIISDNTDVTELCEQILDDFSKAIKPLYSEEDWNKGFIISKNRKGETEEFPVVSISISVAIKENPSTLCKLEEFSQIITKLKTESKAIEGNSIVRQKLSCC